MHKSMEKTLRIFLIILALYFIGDGLIHILNIRLASVVNIWPQSAISYGHLLNDIYSSFVFLVAALIFIIQKDLKKYRSLIFISGFWAFFHGFLLIYLSLSQDFGNNFANLSSLHVWIPFYSQYLLFEASIALIYSLLVFTWIRQSKF